MSPALFSVGYEGRTLDELLELLRSHAVTVLADVRYNAISRKPGFSKRAFGAALAEAGIEYRHLRALGNPKDNRAAFHAGDVRGGVAAFEALLSGEPQRAALADLAALAETERVAVLCFERDHERCHRQAVLAALPGGTNATRL